MRQLICDLCGKADFAVLDKRKAKSLLICKTCTLITQYPKRGNLSKFYKDDYKREYECQETPTMAWIFGNKRVAKERYDFLKQHIKIPGNVLDVGSSTGEFVRLFKDGVGVEPSKTYNDYARLAGVNNVNCMFEDFTTDKRFDLVSMFHVLEFFESPKVAVKKAYTLLENDGYLYIENPNRMKPYGTIETFFADPHLYTFYYYTIFAMLHMVGFKVVYYYEDRKKLRVIAQKSTPQLNPVVPSYKKLIGCYKWYKFRYYTHLCVWFWLKRHVKEFLSKILPDSTIQWLKKFI